jgi:hypothetical protein
MTHSASPIEAVLVLRSPVWPMTVAAVVWVLYLGLEPMIRKAWPTALISWTRLLEGRVRDSRVCRDVLVGLAATTVLIAVDLLLTWLTPFGRARPAGLTPAAWAGVHSLREGMAQVLNNITIGVFLSLALVFVYALLHRVFRQDWIAGSVVVLFFAVAAVVSFTTGQGLYGAVTGFVGALALLIALVRFGSSRSRPTWCRHCSTRA